MAHKKFFLSVSCFIVCISFCIISSFGEGSFTQINSYNEFRDYLKEVILSQNTTFTVQINNFDPNIYLLDKAMDELQKTYPEVSFLFKEARNSSLNGYLNSRAKIMRYDITYNYSIGELNKMYVARNPHELKNAFIESFRNFDTKIYVKIIGYSKEKYDFSQIIEDALVSSPGYGTGCKAAQTIIYGNGEDVVVNFTYQFFYDFNTIKRMRQKGDEIAEQVVASIIKDGMSDYEKELAIHDYIVNNTVYAQQNSQKNSENSSSFAIERSVYGVLVNKSAVCEGYALAMKKLLDLSGVYSTVALGRGMNELHAWNIVKIQGKFYHVDSTWDDIVLSNGRNDLQYKYFNVTDKVMQMDHSWETFRYPECNSTDYDYPNIMEAIRGGRLTQNNNLNINYSTITNGYVKFAIGSPYYVVNGAIKEIDPGREIVPVIRESRTLLPIRVVAQAILAKVGWNGATNAVSVQSGGNSIYLTIGKNVAVVNGKNKDLDSSATIINSRTFVPLRFISENIGCKIVWDDDLKEVTIFYPLLSDIL